MVTGAPVKARPFWAQQEGHHPRRRARLDQPVDGCGYRITSSSTRSSGNPCADPTATMCPSPLGSSAGQA
jgi:hypothetical protein